MNDNVNDESLISDDHFEPQSIGDEMGTDDLYEGDEIDVDDDLDDTEEEFTIENDHSIDTEEHLTESGHLEEDDHILDVNNIDAQIPIKIDVQLGTLVVNAADSAALTEGDVLTLETVCAGQVSLVCQGREVGRGELVDIDGRLGVQVINNWCKS